MSQIILCQQIAFMFKNWDGLRDWSAAKEGHNIFRKYKLGR